MDSVKKAFAPGEALVPGLALAFAVAYLVQTHNAPAAAMRWPTIILAVTALLWLPLVVRYVFSRQPRPAAPATGGSRTLPLLMVGWPVAYLLVLPYLGFAVATMLFLPVFFRLLGSRSWGRNLAVALALTCLLQLTLIVLLHMSLPRLGLGSFVL